MRVELNDMRNKFVCFEMIVPNQYRCYLTTNK
jgi:hypothetical protein